MESYQRAIYSLQPTESNEDLSALSLSFEQYQLQHESLQKRYLSSPFLTIQQGHHVFLGFSRTSCGDSVVLLCSSGVR